MANYKPGFPEPGIEKRWTIFGNVENIVNEKFEDGRGLAQSMLSRAEEVINGLKDLADELGPIDVEVPIPNIAPPDIGEFTATPPSSPTIDLNLPTDLNEADDVYLATHDKILHDLNSQSPATPDSVETAIFEREAERALQIHRDTLDRVSAEWSARNMPLPDQFLGYLLTQAEIDYANKRHDMSRDVAIKNFELTDTNMKFMVEKGIQWYGMKVQTYTAKIQAEVARIEAVVKKYIGEVEVYKGTAQVYMTLADVEIKQFDAELKAALARADLVIKDAEIDIENYKALNGLKIEIAKAVSGVYAQMVAGALSSVSASVQMAADNRASYNFTPPPLESIDQ